MTETEFLSRAEESLMEIELSVDRLAEAEDLDIECHRSGKVLDIEFVEQGERLIVNIQAPLQELWLAGKAGGFHFRLQAQQWMDTRGHGELYAVLSQAASVAAGREVRIARE